MLLNVREVATLWHLPQGTDEVPMLDRTLARRLLPAPAARAGVGKGCPIGVSRHQERAVPVVLPAAALARNSLLVARTGKGKSTLMEHLAVWLAVQGDAAVVVVDPHGDLARSVLAALPPAGVSDPIWLDFADQDWPVGLNLLDAHLGRSRDKTVANVIDIFSRIWDKAWGARMEDCLRYCLLTLYEVNRHLPPDRQYSVLAVQRLLLDLPFRRALLHVVEDAEVKRWWRQDFEAMPASFAQEVIKPVLTKLARLAGTQAAANILGQPRTTLDVRAVVRERRVLLVNTATGVLGPGTAGLLGATLVDLLDLVIQEQAVLSPAERVPVRVLLDEFQAIPAVDYSRLLGQLRKFGASFTLATQALARLDAEDRALRGTVFGNVDTLAAFAVSAEDARYLAHELDGLVDETDLINLPDYTCYLKTLDGGAGRAPTCLVETLPPLPGDAEAAREVVRRSAGLYGRPIEDVEALRREVGRQHHVSEAEGRAREAAAEAAGTALEGAPAPAAAANRGTQPGRGRGSSRTRGRGKPVDPALQPGLPA